MVTDPMRKMCWIRTHIAIPLFFTHVYMQTFFNSIGHRPEALSMGSIECEVEEFKHPRDPSSAHYSQENTLISDSTLRSNCEFLHFSLSIFQMRDKSLNP